MPSQLRPTFESELPTAKDHDELAMKRGFCHVAAGGGREADAYDPEENEERALADPLAVVARAAQVVVGLGRYYASMKFDEWFDNTGPEAVRARSRELRETLVSLGPCYIKVGQALANRPDIVRDDYMEELQELQDSVPAFPSREAMEIMRRELGREPREIFSSLTEEPVAAASLGQVYRGRLRGTNQEVAVKVQRPGLRQALSVDMFIFRSLAQLLNDWAQRSLGCNITLVVDEFGAKLWEESNYLVEAGNARNFLDNFAKDPTVKIPRVYAPYTTQKLITMEWIEGVKSSNLAGLRRAGIDVDAFIRNGVQASLRQLLEFGLFHGDPHAGNIFAMRDGRIAYVDFGNVASITAKQRDVLVRAITHVANSDYAEIANDFIRLGFMRPGTDVSDMVPAMALIWKDSMGKSIRDFNFRTVTARFSKLVFQFPIRIPERFSLVIRALLMQEGICMCLNDEFSIIEVALPYASSRLLTDPDPSMRRELMSIAFREENGRPVLQWKRLIDLVSLAKQARDGTSIRFDQVIVDFLRGARQDLAREGREGAAGLSRVVRQGLEALAPDGRLRMEDVRQVLELLGPDLTPELGRQVADALVRDSVKDLLNERGVEIAAADLTNPREVGKILGSPDQLRKLLPSPPAV